MHSIAFPHSILSTSKRIFASKLHNAQPMRYLFDLSLVVCAAYKIRIFENCRHSGMKCRPLPIGQIIYRLTSDWLHFAPATQRRHSISFFITIKAIPIEILQINAFLGNENIGKQLHYITFLFTWLWCQWVDNTKYMCVCVCVRIKLQDRYLY